MLGASVLVALIPAVAALVFLADFSFVVLVILDWWRTPRPAQLVLDRELPETVGLSAAFERRVRISGAPQREQGYRIELHEEFPDCFQVLARTVGGQGEESVLGAPAGRDPAGGDPSGGADCIALSPAGAAVVRRTYRSGRRGEFTLGDLRLSITGPLGLVARQERFAGKQGVVVESALANLRSTLALAASERWRDLGVRRRRRSGGQSEFESLRDYVRGDDVRLVDWKAFARRGKPTVRMYREERGQELIVMFDCGRRMRATAAGADPNVRWSKLDWALDAGLQLAAVALQHGDRVGCVVFDSDVRAWIPPARGKRQFTRLREAVYSFQPSRRDANLARALRELAVRHRRNATVTILTDVADPLSIADQKRALSAASRRHRVVFACLDDPEVRQAAAGHDLERHAGNLPGVALRSAAMDAIEERHQSLRQLASTGVRVLDALPAEAAGPLLTAWLDARRFG